MTDKIKIDTIVFLLLFLLITVSFFLMFRPFFEALILAITFSIIFRPLYTKILKKIKNETSAALLTTLLVFSIVLLPIIFVTFEIVNEAQHLYLNLSQNNTLEQSALSNITTQSFDYIGQYIPKFNIEFNQISGEVGKWLFENLSNIFSGVLSIGLSLFIFVFAFFYLLRDSQPLVNFFEKLSPLTSDQDKTVLEKLHKTIYSVVVGSLLIALIQGGLTGLALFVAGIPQALLWGSLGVILAIIPALGPTLILIPVGIYYLVTGAVIKGIGLILWGIIVVGLIDNLLRPILLKRGMEIHPFLILISVLGGMSLFGIVGFLVGPIILSLFLALTVIYTKIVHQGKILE